MNTVTRYLAEGSSIRPAIHAEEGGVVSPYWRYGDTMSPALRSSKTYATELEACQATITRRLQALADWVKFQPPMFLIPDSIKWEQRELELWYEKLFELKGEAKNRRRQERRPHSLHAHP